MKKILNTLFVAFLTLVGPVSYAQQNALKNIPKSIEVFRPEALDRPITNQIADELVKNHGQKVSSQVFVKTFWDVYSDRDDNTTYATPRNKTPYSSLKMGEKVRIARFRGDFALVYSVDESDNTPYPRLPARVDWKGWVPVSNLLLWDTPLVTEDGVKRKMLLDASILTATPSDNIGKLYRHPLVNAIPVASLPASTTNSFFYLLKQEGTMCLLSTDKSTGRDMENLYGWVSINSVNPWENNIALEPTWDIPTVKDFASIGFFSSLNLNLNDADSALGTVSFKDREMPFYRTDFFREAGDVWRFPVRGLSIGGYHYALVPVDSPYLKGGSANALNEDQQNVNLYFVMDGSRDYEDFFPVILDGIGNIPSLFPGLNVKVGAAIYHDIRNEDFSVELMPATDVKNRALLDFIDEGGEFGFRDNAAEPALFPAIQEVLDKGGMRPSETNVILVIGGHGDASSVDISQLADRLDGSNIQLYSIQVQNNASATSFQLFNFQMENLIYSKLADRVEKTGTERDVILQTARKSGEVNIVNYALNTPDRIYAEEHRYINSGIMEEADFGESVKQVYAKIAQEIASKKVSGAGLVNQSKVFMSLYMTRMDRSNRSFYKYVALYDDEEFEALMSGFKDIYEAGLTSDSPTRSMCDIITNLLGCVPDSSPVKREDRGYFEALRLIEGIHGIPNEYPGVSLKKMRDLKGFTAEEGRRLMDDFSLKYQKLLEIKNAAYPYVTTINGRRCYWIPIEFLP